MDERRWLSLPEVAEALDVPLRTVRGYLRDRVLVATRRGENNALAVPDDFLVTDNESAVRVVLPALRGTVTLLADSGYADEEIVDWLLRDNDELGGTPLQALRSGRVHAVRRAAQTLAF
ncbi:MAG TPA: DNA-binding protein [Candidatus Ruania gallistercoris]|uniref:DNA-binding protein n=1 Tax=Candidatus Ruania gallistercoris TaxID=2838746 RepID=A0A9D2EHI5_9MICO|nr:DNA-binding protein [Candidatus Ruania gallistercoris]